MGSARNDPSQQSVYLFQPFRQADLLGAMGEWPTAPSLLAACSPAVGTKRAIRLRDRWLWEIEVLHAVIQAYWFAGLLAHWRICLIGRDDRDDATGDRNGSQAPTTQTAASNSTAASASCISPSKATHGHGATARILASK